MDFAMGDNIKAVVLAAGKGVRMQSELPKVLHLLNNKPLISHVIENINKAGISDIIVVVGYKGDDVISSIGNKVKYVWQKEQLGTGHAAMQAEKPLEGFNGSVVIACGDVPLLKPETFKDMIALSESKNTKAVVLTMIQDDPAGYGRIVKDKDGNFIKIVEAKDANPEEKKIKEVNTGTYIFDKDLLFAGLKTLSTNNAQGEYYLTDVLYYVIKQGFNVKTLVLENAVEGAGINSREDLANLESLIKQKF